MSAASLVVALTGRGGERAVEALRAMANEHLASSLL
jgi:hypothetical protein